MGLADLAVIAKVAVTLMVAGKGPDQALLTVVPRMVL
jgi:hypothetical protein